MEEAFLTFDLWKGACANFQVPYSEYGPIELRREL